MIGRRTTPTGGRTALRRELRLSRLALWAERLAVALWPAFSVICLTLAAGLLGLFDALGPVLHRVGLGIAGVALVVALVLGLGGFRRPGRADARHRLEEDDPARPLSTLTDRLAGGAGSETAHRLWQAHRARAERAAAGLRARAPDLRLARRDRWALRLFAPAALVGAFIGAGGNWVERVETTLLPRPADRGPDLVAAEPAAEAWAVPPAYTGLDTVYLDGDDGRRTTLPAGSVLTVRVTGLGSTPVLEGDALDGIEGFAALGAGLHEAKAELSRSGRLRVTTGATVLGDWRFEITPDTPPRIESTGRPGANMTMALEVPFAAADDHGVVAAWAKIRLADPVARPMPVEAPEFALPLPISGDPRNIADTAVADLTAHPWAGAEVVLTLGAEDGAGQVTEAPPIRLTLPERPFTHPLARALVDQRRALALDLDRAEHVLDTVQAVTRWPEEVFGTETGAYLGVRMATRRLAHAIVGENEAETAPTVADLFWQAALSLEEGDAADALEKLRQAEEALRRALESGTEEDIRRAMDRLRQAMNEYLRQLAQQALQNPQAQQQQQPGRELSRQDLERMLDEMQERAESGMRDQAQAMLDQLSQMLQNLRPGQQQAGQSDGEQALQQLQDMIQRQRRLSDETFDELRRQQRGQDGQEGQQQQPGQQGQRGQQPGNRPGQQPGQPGGEGGAGGNQSGRHGENGRLAAEQEALRQALEGLRNQLGGGEGMRGASRALGDAEGSMGEARDDLDRGRNGDAVQDQMDALDSLNRGAEALAEALQQQGQGQQAAQGTRTGRGERGDDREADPFDRPAGAYGTIDGTGTSIPDRELMDRARELLEELRRRSADQTRPPLELDYLQRLLDRF